MSDGPSGWRNAAFRWTVIEGNRLVVAGALLGAILVTLLVLLAVGLFPSSPGDPLYLLFSAFLGGNITLITVVIAINQLVFSRELGSPGDLEQRTRNAVEYRDQVQEVMDRAVSPVMPGSFLLVLHENLDTRAETLHETITNPEDDLGAEIDELVGELQADVTAGSPFWRWRCRPHSNR